MVLESTITKSIEDTLSNIKIITGSMDCQLITIEGSWDVCKQRCEFPSQFVFRPSDQAKNYIAEHNNIHILDQRGIKDLELKIQNNSYIFIPLTFESMNLGVILLEHTLKDLSPSQELFFSSVANTASIAIGNALKACLFSILEHISHLFTERMELDHRLQIIADGTKNTFGQEFDCEIFLYDPVTETLNLRASTKTSRKFWEMYTTNSNQGLNGWVIKNKKPIGISDVTKDSRAIQEHADLNKIIGVAITPIINHGRILGVINLLSDKPKDFFAEEIWILQMLAQQAGNALAEAIAYEQMEELAMIDPVTKAYSRQYLESKGKLEIQKAIESGESLSLLMLDIDFFKKVNDTYGHQIGDKILKQVSSVIKNNIRTTDVFARYGGEEFIILLPRLSQSMTIEIAERIRKRIMEETEPIVTISIGISFLSPNNTSIDKLIEKADYALYHSKENGRNKVSIYDKLMVSEKRK